MGALPIPSRFLEEPTKSPPAPKGVGFIPLREAGYRSGIPVETLSRRCRSEWGQIRMAALLKPEQGGKPCWHVREDAEAGFARAKSPELMPFDWASITEKQRRTIRLRKRILDSWYQARAELMELGFSEREVTERFIAAAHGEFGATFSRGTLFGWAKAYQSAGRSGLADGRLDHKRRTHTDEFVAELKYHFLRWGRRPSLSYVLTCEKAEEQGWAIPFGPERARQVLKAIPLKEREFHRLGGRAYDGQSGKYIPRDYEQLESNEVWISDGHTFNVFVEHNGRVIRPTLVGWMDARSRKIVGWQILAGAENSDAILLAFKRGVEEYGLPRSVYHDNGKSFDAQVLQGVTKQQRRRQGKGRPVLDLGVFERLEIEVRHALPFNAKAKTIERFWGTICTRFSERIESYCGGDTSKKPHDLEARKRNALRLSELCDVFGNWLDANYHNVPHRGQGMHGRTPNEVYCENLQQTRPIPQADVLDLELCPRVRLKVGRLGIHVNHTIYEAPELDALGGQEVQALIDDDLSRVKVLDLEGRFLCVAQCVRRVPFLATQEQLREAMAVVKRDRRRVRESMAIGPRAADDPIGRLQRIAERERADAPIPSPTSVKPFRSKLEADLPAIRAATQGAPESAATLKLPEDFSRGKELEADQGGIHVTLEDLFRVREEQDKRASG